MTAPSAICRVLWLLSALFVLVFPADSHAQNRPVTIPPATQITPPAQPPAPAPPIEFAGIATAPRALLPVGVDTVRDPLGAGLVMYGQLTGKTDSALGVIAAILAYSGAFDPVPSPLLAVADKNDRAAQSLFAATVRGTTVLGIAVVTLDDSGGNVSVFYDYADSFPSAFPRLQQALGPGRADTGLTALHLADGSDINVAPGWRVLGQGKGIADLAGGQGELMSLGNKLPVYTRPTTLAGPVTQGACCDPVAAVQAAFPQIAANAQRLGSPALYLIGIVDSAAIPTPKGSQAALILATVSAGGRPHSYLALAEATSGFVEPWTLRLSSVMAPQPVFAADLPSLLQIWSSYSGNPQGFAERLKAAAQGMAALQPLLQTEPDATQYRADGGWNDAIKLVVPRLGAAGGNPIDEPILRNLLDRLSKDTGGPWHAAPLPPRGG